MRDENLQNLQRPALAWIWIRNNPWIIGYSRISAFFVSPRRGAERISSSRTPIPGLITPPSPFYFIPISWSEPASETLINTVGELSYKLSARRTCKRRESDDGVAPFTLRANSSLERDGNEIACCAPNSFSLSHRFALRAVGNGCVQFSDLLHSSGKLKTMRSDMNLLRKQGARISSRGNF